MIFPSSEWTSEFSLHQMWISWSWPPKTGLAFGHSSETNKFKDHPVLALFEKSHLLSRIEVTRIRSKRRLCLCLNDNEENVTIVDLPRILWECNDLEKLLLAGNAIQQVCNWFSYRKSQLTICPTTVASRRDFQPGKPHGPLIGQQPAGEISRRNYFSSPTQVVELKRQSHPRDSRVGAENSVFGSLVV